MELDEAQAALSEVRMREGRVREELAAHRPPHVVTALLVVGFFLVHASSAFGYALGLAAGAFGFGLLGAGIWVGIRKAGRSRVGERRDTWKSRNVLIITVFIVGLFVVDTVTETFAAKVMPPQAASLVAALAATLLFAGLVAWTYRSAFGPPRGDK